MDYVLKLLKQHLNQEYIALYSAKEITAGNGMTISNMAMSAFRESERLANERIPQLEKAIEKLTKSKK